MDALSRHYAPADVRTRLLAALRLAGKDPAALTADDLVPLDQFHVGGRPATAALARLAGVTGGLHVLDVGGGLGGSARTLAATTGCHVTVLDATAAYCAMGDELTRRLGLDARVSFVHAAAPPLPFRDGGFDAVWMQHCAMNVEDKPGLYAEAWRVLRPGGRLALHEIMAGAGGALHFPVPWARDPALSFLESPEVVRGILARLGFEEIAWRDESAASLAWYRQRGPGQASAPPVVGLHLLLGPDFGVMARNLLRNLEEGRLAIVMGVWQRPG
jgi:ubiquinone/menaquinone biosynthesis C-methylase UbiE